MNKLNWLNWKKDKPVFTGKGKDCILLTANKINGIYEYDLFEIKRVNFGDGWYYGIFDSDGDEWGAYEEFNADMYAVIELIKPEN